MDCDFADQFELRSDGRQYGKDGARRTALLRADGVDFAYARGDWLSRTTVSATPPPSAVGPVEAQETAHRLEWRLELPAHGMAELLLTATAHPHGAPAGPASAHLPSRAAADRAAGIADFAGDEPLPIPADAPEGLAAACARGLSDLAALRVPAVGPDGEELTVPGDGGYLVYSPDAEGLVNQNWKDSAGAICFLDGTQAEGPIAVAEAQGYAYDALVRTARLARTVWDDTDWAEELDTAAGALRDRFLRDFWMPGPGFPALALDGRGRQVDSLASDADTCCGRESSTVNTPTGWVGACSNPTSSPAGPPAPWPPGSRAITRSRTTAAAAGRTTTP